MSKFTELGYVVVGTSRLAQWRDFASNVLGLRPVERPGAVWLRMDQWAQRFVIIPHETERLLTLGWCVGRREDLADLRASIEAAGAQTTPGDEAACQVRGVEEFFAFNDPAGNQHEVFWGRTKAGTPFVSPVGVKSFVADDLGLGHVVLMAGDHFDEIATFWKQVGALELTDYQYIPATPTSPRRRTHFYRCGPRHHSVAYGSAKSPSFGCHHLMIEVPDLDDVGMALDRALAHQVGLACTLGRHSNDGMTSIYLDTPSGFLVEFGWRGLLVTSDHETANYAEANIWGHVWQEQWLERWKAEQSRKH